MTEGRAPGRRASVSPATWRRRGWLADGDPERSADECWALTSPARFTFSSPMARAVECRAVPGLAGPDAGRDPAPGPCGGWQVKRSCWAWLAVAAFVALALAVMRREGAR